MENGLNLLEEQSILFDKSGIIDTYDEKNFLYKCENVRIISDELAAIKNDGEWVFIDKYGDDVAYSKYEKFELLTDDRIKAISEEGETDILNELGKVIISGMSTVIYKDEKGYKIFEEGSCVVFKKRNTIIEKNENEDEYEKYEREQREYEEQLEYEQLSDAIDEGYYYDDYEVFFNTVELLGKFFIEYKENKAWCIYDYNGKELFYVLELLSSRDNIYSVVNIQNEYNKKYEIVEFDNDWSKFEKTSYNKNYNWDDTPNELNSMYRDAFDNNPDAEWNIY